MSFFRQNDLPLSGKHFYKDKHNRIVYYNPILKKAYRINPLDENTMKSLQARFVIGLVVFALFNIIFKIPVSWSVIAGLVVFIAFELRLLKLLKSSNPVPNFNPQNFSPTVEDKYKKLEKKDYLLRIFLYFLLGGLLIFYALTDPEISVNNIYKVSLILIAALSFVFGTNYIQKMFKHTK